MIRISQIKMPLAHTQEDVLRRAAKILRIEQSAIKTFSIVKKSIDARKKPEIMIVYTADVATEQEEKILAGCKSGQVQKLTEVCYQFPVCGFSPRGKGQSRGEGERKETNRPLIVGAGPAGLFCGYMLAVHGFAPVLLERGAPVEERRKDVEAFWEQGVLLPDSNVQFGEGGAGTFSDGKLNTLVKDKFGRNREVLRILTEAGAPEEILYMAKPHIGTDILTCVVKNIREKIIACGGAVRFHAKVTALLTEENRGEGRVRGVVLESGEEILSDTVVLAPGHSARDTFRMLYEKQVPMEAKAFAVGLRVEHPRRMINKMQYGMEEHPCLPTADYKVTAKTKSGRGVYSFCMCPGGYVVNASSEKGKTAVNGMSYSSRDGENSNSAMIVTVTPEDFDRYNDGAGEGAKAGMAGDKVHPLAGIAFQRRLEERAFAAGNGAVPVETYGDYREAVTGQAKPPSRIKEAYPDFTPKIKGAYAMAPVHKILPEDLNQSLVEGMELIDKTMPGFADSGAYLSGVESRTSSPVRILRDETGQSALRGLYPCGEGAGYAGGIMSAAMDGILTAEKIACKEQGREGKA